MEDAGEEMGERKRRVGEGSEETELRLGDGEAAWQQDKGKGPDRKKKKIKNRGPIAVSMCCLSLIPCGNITGKPGCVSACTAQPASTWREGRILAAARHLPETLQKGLGGKPNGKKEQGEAMALGRLAPGEGRRGWWVCTGTCGCACACIREV